MSTGYLLLRFLYLVPGWEKVRIYKGFREIKDWKQISTYMERQAYKIQRRENWEIVQVLIWVYESSESFW